MSEEEEVTVKEELGAGDEDDSRGSSTEVAAQQTSATKTVIIKASDLVTSKASSAASTSKSTASVVTCAGNGGNGHQQIYIIQTSDGAIPVESAEVVVSDDMAVYETVSALEQLSRGQVVTTAADGEQLIQVCEEVVLPESSSGQGSNNGLIADSFVDVAEVEVGDVRSSSPVKIDTASAIAARLRQAAAGSEEESQQGGDFHICRICNQFVPIAEIAEHNHEHHGAVSDLTCLDCGKIFKSKRSLFGHRKEKHSGVTEVHSCPECGKTFGRKSNLKAHRESLHYGKKFPCQLCERIFTNRSSMNQHIKKTHVGAGLNLESGMKIVL